MKKINKLSPDDNDNEVGKRILQIRKIELGLTGPEFVLRIQKHLPKFESGSLSKYENGLVKPTTEFYKALYNEFGYYPSWVMTGKGLKKEGELMKLSDKAEDYSAYYNSIKVYGRVDAGSPVDRWNHTEKVDMYHPAMEKIRGEIIGFKVEGVSMEGAAMEGGELLTTEINMSYDKPKDGDYVIVMFKSGLDSSKAKFKKFRWANEKTKSFILDSINPAFPTEYHEIKEVAKFFRVHVGWSIFNKNLMK